MRACYDCRVRSEDQRDEPRLVKEAEDAGTSRRRSGRAEEGAPCYDWWQFVPARRVDCDEFRLDSERLRLSEVERKVRRTRSANSGRPRQSTTPQVERCSGETRTDQVICRGLARKYPRKPVKL